MTARTSSPAWPWALAGLVAGVAGLATSAVAAVALVVHDAPVDAIAALVVRLTPGPVVEVAIRLLDDRDKPFLVTVVVLVSMALFATAGRLARRRRLHAVLLLAAMAALGAVAVLVRRAADAADLVPVAVGFVTWVGCLWLLTSPLRREADDAAPLEPGLGSTRRELLVRSGAVLGGAAVVRAVGGLVGDGRGHVEAARRLLRLPGVRPPRVPSGASVGVDGVAPWATPAADFYRIDTAFVVPTIAPTDWRLRIHGMVEREVELTYQDLVDRELTEAWVTLNCVSNPVGGDLVGNAWWSGVRVGDLLERAGVRPDADAVLQTSEDGWTCATPLAALTDGRDAMLAVAMNGRPLPIDHGFPVRTIVPGLYGYVSACKWVVDLKVTRFADVEAFWTRRGWSEQGPVKIASRIDVPVEGGQVSGSGGRVAGVAWMQHIGIRDVEVRVDDGEWRRAELGRVPSADTWVQWAATIDVEPGPHTLAVRAVDADGRTQTGQERDVAPNGATGWHTVRFEAT